MSSTRHVRRTLLSSLAIVALAALSACGNDDSSPDTGTGIGDDGGTTTSGSGSFTLTGETAGTGDSCPGLGDVATDPSQTQIFIDCSSGLQPEAILTITLPSPLAVGTYDLSMTDVLTDTFSLNERGYLGADDGTSTSPQSLTLTLTAVDSSSTSTGTALSGSFTGTYLLDDNAMETFTATF
jgi:hypothetical protein